MTESPDKAQTDALPDAPAEDDKPFGLLDYIIVNVLFVTFLAIVAIFMKSLFPESNGVPFFFTVLAIGFIGVSAYDYLFDWLYQPAKDEESAEKS